MVDFPNTSDTVWTYMRRLANKRLQISSQFYADGNKTFGIEIQSVAVDVDDEELLHGSESSFQCAVPGCGRWLYSVLEQEAHYSSRHRHRCGVCAAQLPTQHALEMHLEERHDSVFQLKSQRQNMYRCFVESCDVLSADDDSRRKHCTEEHNFPADFSYLAPQPPQPKLNRVPQPAQPELNRVPQPAQLELNQAVQPELNPMVNRAPQPAQPELNQTFNRNKAGNPRLRFSYKVPASDVSFGGAAVPSFRRAAAVATDGRIDMASLSAALDAEDAI